MGEGGSRDVSAVVVSTDRRALQQKIGREEEEGTGEGGLSVFAAPLTHGRPGRVHRVRQPAGLQQPLHLGYLVRDGDAARAHLEGGDG